MSFYRVIPALPARRDLDRAMRGLGMRVGRASERALAADIELTLIAVAREGVPDDFRLLGVLLAWLEVHQARVNVPRLGRVLSECSEPDRVLERAFWTAVATWLARTDARWRPLSAGYEGQRLDLDDPEITALQMRSAGEDPRFEGTVLRVHAKLLRSRKSDVETPVELAHHHVGYLRRVELGANYRADVFASLDLTPDASPAAIARGVGCAYETARASARDWWLAREARHTSGSTVYRSR